MVRLRGNYWTNQLCGYQSRCYRHGKTWDYGTRLNYGITCQRYSPGYRMTDMVDKNPKEHVSGNKGKYSLKNSTAETIDMLGICI